MGMAKLGTRVAVVGSSLTPATSLAEAHRICKALFSEESKSKSKSSRNKSDRKRDRKNRWR